MSNELINEILKPFHKKVIDVGEYFDMHNPDMPDEKQAGEYS